MDKAEAERARKELLELQAHRYECRQPYIGISVSCNKTESCMNLVTRQIHVNFLTTNTDTQSTVSLWYMYMLQCCSGVHWSSKGRSSVTCRGS